MRPGFITDRSLLTAAAVAFSLTVAAPLTAAEPGPANLIPLFPQKEEDLKNGLPPGMTAATFQAGHGTAALRKLDDGQVEIAFEFAGLIPYGVYTLWNVLETEPFKDEPLGEFRGRPARRRRRRLRPRREDRRTGRVAGQGVPARLSRGRQAEPGDRGLPGRAVG